MNRSLNTRELPIATSADVDDQALLPELVRLLKSSVDDLREHVKVADQRAAIRDERLELKVDELQRHQNDLEAAIHARLDALTKGTP